MVETDTEWDERDLLCLTISRIVINAKKIIKTLVKK